MRGVRCRWREPLLLRAYNDVAASCGVSAGVTLVKMTGYLVSLSYVNVTDDTCTGRKTSRSTMFIIFCSVVNLSTFVLFLYKWQNTHLDFHGDFLSIKQWLVIYTVVHPRTTSPQWIGPLYLYNVMYLGTGPFTDFYFICRVNTPHRMNETARFEVFLMFDSRMSSVTRTVTPASLDVVFSSHDISSGFGTKVSLQFITHVIQQQPLCILCRTYCDIDTHSTVAHTSQVLHCVSKKGPTLKRYSSKLYKSILMIFDRNMQMSLE